MARTVPAGAPDGITWVRGDAMRADEVLAAARDCQVIVHAVNPPGYRNWSALVLPMLDNTIAAARRVGAMIVLPGTVYNYGPDAFALIGEDAPQRPVTRKGAIRAEMERRLRDAGVNVLVVRAGDFFGPAAGNNWFSQGLIRAGRPVTAVSDPGAAGVGHQWAYLPDVARTMVELLRRRDTLPPFAAFHMGGHWDADGSQMAAAIRRVVGKETGIVPRGRRFPWWLLTLASPFVTTFREMREMRYLWQRPVQLENRRLVDFLGFEPHTPLDEAVAATLRGLGCLADGRPRETSADGLA